MYYKFQSIDQFLFSIEKEIIDTLFDYGLLTKFDRNVKKIIFFFFVKRLTERLNADNDLLFYHTNAWSDGHELFEHFDREKLSLYLDTILKKIKKVTNRTFFLKKQMTLPHHSFIDELEGSVIDEVLLLKVRKPVDPQELKEFLNKNHLKDLFSNLSKKVCA